MAQPSDGPSPQLFFDTINAYQRTAALRTAIQLDVFSQIAREPGGRTAAAIASACGAAERGVRILCDYLAMMGFLQKRQDAYTLTPDSAKFLDRASKAYLGGASEFLLSPTLTDAFERLDQSVRIGGTALPEGGTVGSGKSHDAWVQFARAMAALMFMPSQALAELVLRETPAIANKPVKVLDIAAGHGLFGIAMAQRLPQATVVSQDWPEVLAVARDNADRMGVGPRVQMQPGDAMQLDFGRATYDLVLLTNFLHHFDRPTIVRVLKKLHAALKPGGRAVTLEFIPNDDRISPPPSAGFALTMLATTPAGDAYTFGEYETIFRDAGFRSSRLFPLPPTFQQVVISDP